MRCCFYFREGRIGLLDMSDAPPTIEFDDPRRSHTTRILERVTRTADPVDGIVLYEETER